MKKVDLYKAYLREDRVRMHLWERWFDWRCEQAGLDGIGGSENKAWMEVLKSMPNIWDWTPHAMSGGSMKFTWKNEDEKHTEYVPIGYFIDDLVEQPDLRMLWHNGYYDGPLSGMCKWDGKLYYFDVAYDDEEESELDYRKYNLYELTQEELEEELRTHRLFETNVGYHSNYGDRYREYGDNDKPKWCPNFLYKQWRKARFWKFYKWDSPRSKSHRFSTVDRQPVATFYECQFNRERGNQNV